MKAPHSRFTYEHKGRKNWEENYRIFVQRQLTLRLLISYIYGAHSRARNANVVYIWTYVWQR